MSLTTISSKFVVLLQRKENSERQYSQAHFHLQEKHHLGREEAPGFLKLLHLNATFWHKISEKGAEKKPYSDSMKTFLATVWQCGFITIRAHQKQTRPGDAAKKNLNSSELYNLSWNPETAIISHDFLPFVERFRL